MSSSSNTSNSTTLPSTPVTTTPTTTTTNTSSLTAEEIYNEEPLTSTTRPETMATITVRVIKSFPYRTVKSHVFTNIDLTTTTGSQLLKMTKDVITKLSAFRAYRGQHASDHLNAIKIYTHAHGAKSMNLVINFDHDDVADNSDHQKWLIVEENELNHLTLKSLGVENETELSVFNYNDYLEFKKNPEEKWI